MSQESPARISRCPRCAKSIRLSPDNPWRPFCSERCKTIDMGDWFSERNRIPGKTLEEMPEAGDDEQE